MLPIIHNLRYVFHIQQQFLATCTFSLAENFLVNASCCFLFSVMDFCYCLTLSVLLKLSICDNSSQGHIFAIYSVVAKDLCLNRTWQNSITIIFFHRLNNATVIKTFNTQLAKYFVGKSLMSGKLFVKSVKTFPYRYVVTTYKRV